MENLSVRISPQAFLQKGKIFSFSRIHSQKKNLDFKANVVHELLKFDFRFGLPARECVLRMICESKTYLNLPGVSIVEDLLRILLRYVISCKISNFGIEKNTKEHEDK